MLGLCIIPRCVTAGINCHGNKAQAWALWQTHSESLFLVRALIFFIICDVICEKGPYCGTNIIGTDQTPRMMRGV